MSSSGKFSIVSFSRKLFQSCTQLLLEKLLTHGTMTGGHRGCLHELMMTAEAGATTERGRLQLYHLGRELGADALPTRFAASVTHREITLPELTANSIADHAGSLKAVTAALGAVQGNLIVGPGDATGEAGTELSAQIFDGQDGFRADI